MRFSILDEAPKAAISEPRPPTSWRGRGRRGRTGWLEGTAGTVDNSAGSGRVPGYDAAPPSHGITRRSNVSTDPGVSSLSPATSGGDAQEGGPGVPPRRNRFCVVTV